MKQLGEITEEAVKQGGTSLTTSSSNTLPAKVLRTAEEEAQISVTIRQCFDLFNTYGKDPSALKSMLPVFEEVLAAHPTDKIMGAFKEWLRTQSAMPTPADILKILNWDPLPKSAESRSFDRQAEASQKAFERYRMLTPEEKKAHDELMAQIRSAGAPETKLTKGPGKLDYSHWDKMPPEAKELAKIKPPRQAGA